MECFHRAPDGRVLCSHESDDGACATKLLWTRVQGGVTKALAGTTLAELVEFSGGISDDGERAVAPVGSAA
jgi:DNA-binding IscR family transcriptional regulator